ncbi:PIG-L family deacetylase [Halocola ammonii]
MHINLKQFILFIFCLPLGLAIGQAPEKPSSAEIYKSIKKLNFLGSALYVAAHPDDENTSMIAYLSNEVNARTGYLSLTRGDGGQNLIGPEIRELLGVIRTQELLMARSVDGGVQRFSRANDFGYSKSAEETLEIWNRDEVLADAVWAIRTFRPDVIINRFDAETSRRTHGHHTASAILSLEAFELAGDESKYPSQLEYTETWNPSRAFFNTSWWFYGSREAFEEADKSEMVSVDVGVYYPVRGESNSEIAAQSRSMHKCQGFGTAARRGSDMEYLRLLKGEMPKNNDIFEGINTTWSRVEGGEKIGEILYDVEENFDFTNPSSVVPQLVEAHGLISQLNDDHWREIKLRQIEDIIMHCTGLFIEATSADQFATPGSEVGFNVEAINRSDVDINFKSVEIVPGVADTTVSSKLENNKNINFSTTAKLPESIDFTAPYWLREPGTLGMYKVDEQGLIGQPETPAVVVAKFHLGVAGKPLTIEREVVHTFTDAVDGEVYRPFDIIPKATVTMLDKVYIFSSSESKEVDVEVKAGIANLSGKLRLKVPAGWSVSPKEIDVQLERKMETKKFSFTVTPPNGQSVSEVHPIFLSDGEEFDKSLIEINYDHIPYQSVLMPAKSKIVKIAVEKRGERVAYIQGAGDEIPESLRQIGYQVEEIELKEATPEKLKNYDAVILGIRAFNTLDALAYKKDDLFEYVENGGTLISQYTTTWNLDIEETAPYELQLSRDRVTVEEAEVRFLKPDHPVLNSPNKITQEDFEGWVQERGLYFADKWAPEFEAILSSNDPGEDPKDGGLLVAKYGKGYYVYTGYSWFRELPAGVPGAYRIYANILSLGKMMDDER